MLGSMTTKTHKGSCHCGAVKFEVELEEGKPGSRCNCSICTKTNVFSALGKPSSMSLLAGEENLAVYEWGAKISKRYFCKTCGVACFGKGHLAEVGGDYVSVNLNCLDDLDPSTLEAVHWDGRHNNWEGGPRPAPWPIFTPPATGDT
jgi:hypothetical protein